MPASDSSFERDEAEAMRLAQQLGLTDEDDLNLVAGLYLLSQYAPSQRGGVVVTASQSAKLIEWLRRIPT